MKLERNMQVTAKLLRRLCPSAKQEIIEGVAEYFNKHAEKYSVTSEDRVCHFFAQSAHESAHFMTLTEYADGSAYEGRSDLGNTQPGDGVRYKGRGIFQLTGRANYRAYGQKLGLDLENNPQLAQTPEVSVLTALEYWKDRKLSDYADQNNVEMITRRINGGLNGFEERKHYLEAMRKLIHADLDALQKGDKSPEVKKIQEALVARGYKIGTDGDFGPGTENAVKQFQQSQGLGVTGVVDKETAAKLV